MSVLLQGLTLSGITISNGDPPPRVYAGLLVPLATPTISTPPHPIDITVSPDGKNVYTSNSGSGSISQYTVDTTTGLLSLMSPGSVSISDSYPQGIAVSPDGLFVYLCTQTAIYRFSRSAVDGSLTLLSGTTAIVYGSRPVISQDGKNLYGVGLSWITIYARNTITGAITATGATVNVGGTPHDAILDNSGLFLYISVAGLSKVFQFSRDPSTGYLTALSTPSVSPPGAASIGRMAISPDNNFLYLGDGGSSLLFQYSRDTSTGLLSLVAAASPAYINVPWLPPDGQNIYGVTASTTASQLKINKTTGRTTALVPPTVVASTSQAYAMTGSPDGNFAYVADYTNSLIRQFSRT